jgi:hypothetical protein
MATAVATSNVYYLPAVTPPAERVSKPVRVMAMRRVWWRLRFALAGIRLALRPAPATLFAEEPMELAGQAEIIDRRRPSQPARVIDIGAARERLRPVS